MQSIRIGLVAGEASGDILGSHVLAEIKKRIPNCIFEGIGGPEMQAAGLISWFDMERLSVMGLIDPLKRLPELLSIRNKLKTRWLENPPDLFLGIDAPDFNLNVERTLRKVGIPTVHLVSPTIWAWRSGRLKTIEQAADAVLCLFPFEPEAYLGSKVEAQFVGHPMAQVLGALPERAEIRESIALDQEVRIVALLPGSRAREIQMLLPIYLEALAPFENEYQFVIPASNDSNRALIETLVANHDSRATVITGNSRELLKVAQAAVVTSGTATFEAALIGCPMIIAYRMSVLSWFVIRRMIKTPFAGLPNILSQKAVVPELIQDKLSVDSLREAFTTLLQDAALTQQCHYFDQIRAQFSIEFGPSCADVILRLASRK